MGKLGTWTWRVAVATTTVLILSGCGGGSDGEEAAAPTPPGAIVPENPDVGTVTEQSFYVRGHESEKYLLHTRQASGFSSSCEITKGLSNQELTCIVDINEGDLYFNGIELQYNVPTYMCTYLRRSTYWYYNDEVGYGPSSIEIRTVTDASGAVTSAQCNVDGQGLSDCTTTPNSDELEIDADEASVKCVYDQTESDGPNCCFGNYTLVRHETDGSVSIPTPNITTSYGDWGGNWSDCIGGPGRTNWSYYTREGIPASEVTYTRDLGVNEKYTITAPIQSVNGSTNLAVANFYTPAEHEHTGFTTMGAVTVNKPFYIAPLDDRGGSLIGSSNEYYEFECLDDAWEVTNRIRVYVREWDVYSDFLAYLTSSGVTAVPDRPYTDMEGTDCDGVSVDPQRCNDKLDSDDFVNVINSGSYNTGTLTNRRSFFPSEDY